MTVAAGRPFLSIPGPTNVPDEVLQAMQRPAVDIYSGPLFDVTLSALEDLKKIFGTAGHSYIYAGNGHAAWEAALTNVFSRGEKILALQSGSFAVGWGETGRKLGLDVEVLPQSWRRAVDPAAVEERLRQDTTQQIRAVLVVQVDTASSVANDIPAIRRAIDAADHPALFFVDTIASLGTMDFRMDDWGVDVAICGSQKGLMTSPGLAFVAANERAFQIHQFANLRTPYWDWTFREGSEHYHKYAGTPPEHLLFGFRKALDLLLAEGLPAAFERHRLLGEAVRRAVAVWAEGRALDFNIEQPAARSNSVTTVLLSETPGPQALLDYARKRCGVTLGVGINALAGKAFRIAHMGHVNAPMVLGTLGVIEQSLQALQIPHGRGGVQAAIDWLGCTVPA